MNIRKELVTYAQAIAREGLAVGSSGNISVRRTKMMLIKASGIFMKKSKPRDFIGVDIKTLRYGGKSRRPSNEYRMHAACYTVRSDISAVMHTHPFYATFLASCSIKPKIFLPEFVVSAGSHVAVLDYLCPGSKELACRVARCVKDHNIIYLRNHGLLVVGASLQEAFMRTLLTERMAAMQVLALALGKRIKYFSASQVKKLLTSK